MAAEFIGYSVLVTLNNPSGYQLDGVVADVVNQRLVLRNVHLRWSGQRLNTYNLDATSIADLEIIKSLTDDELTTPTATSHSQRDTVPAAVQAPQAQPSVTAPTPFIDPAILSYNRDVRRTTVSSIPQTPISPVMIADSVVHGPARSKPPQSLRGQSSISSIVTTRQVERRDSNATATLTKPFDALAVDEEATTPVPEKRISQTGPGIIDLKDIHSPARKDKKQPGKTKGWRSTPIIEERPVKGRRRGRQTNEDNNGWATEEVTDIAEMGDFDFEGNHAKFDKRKVFDDIRRDDTTADEDRLVSFNRKKPLLGTNNGRNLHFTENVLDVPDARDTNRWKSEAGETEEDDVILDEHYSSGRNSKRAASRRPVQSRKGSAIPTHLDRKEPSPRPLSRMPTGSPMNGSVSGMKASFRIAATNRPCPPISPLQMLELEQLCTSELGLTDDMLTENAGRSIADAIYKAVATGPSTTLPTADGTPFGQAEFKNVLFLLGNHKTAGRALAAARQLRNRRIRVTVVVVGLERGDDHLLETVRKQLKIYRLSLGNIERWDDYQAKLANSAALAGTTSTQYSAVHPPEFIVESLLGVHHAFDEHRTDDQATIFSMIKWANMSVSKLPGRVDKSIPVPILSLDVPSGLSATSGVVAEADGKPLMINSTHIVCLGAPKTGLMAFMAGDHYKVVVDPATWTVYVADVGIALLAWQRNGSRRKQGPDFGNEWVLLLKLIQ